MTTPFEQYDAWRQIGEEEAQVAYDLTLRNELSGATPAVRDFERRWRSWVGSRYAMTTMNGSSALYSAFFGVGIGPGDEVICPTYTWINSIGPALLLGARPVFCESDPETLTLDPEDVRRRITPNTRAIVAVHLWGNVCNMDALMSLSAEFGIPVIEDCSHAHGATYNGRMVGSIGSAGCWSLQSAKPTSAGEGGVLATSGAEIFDRACLVSQCCRMGALTTKPNAVLQPWGLGMKLRAHPLGIGIAAVQLKRLAELNRRRRAYVEAVEAGLKDIPCLQPVRVYPGAVRAGFYRFPVLYDAGQNSSATAEEFIAALTAAGIPATGCGYPLLHLLPLFAGGFDLFTRNRGPLSGDYAGYREGDLPKTEAAHRNLIFLPVLSDPADGAAAELICRIRQAAEAVAGHV